MEEQTKKPIYKKWWFWLIVIAIVIAIASAGSNNDSVETGTKVGNVNTSSNDKTKTQQTEFKVGDIVDTKNTRITFVSSKDYKGYSSYSAPQKGNKVIRTEFKFENLSDSDVILDNLECYADDEKCEPYYYADDYKSPTLESLSKGKKFTAVLYYEVPSNAKNIKLEYETNFWTSSKVIFIVK